MVYSDYYLLYIRRKVRATTDIHRTSKYIPFFSFPALVYPKTAHSFVSDLWGNRAPLVVRGDLRVCWLLVKDLFA